MLLFIFYVAICVIAAIIVFCACDGFDHFLWKRKAEHKTSIVVGYAVPEIGKQVQMMTEQTIDHITDRLMKQTKEMTEEWLNYGKESE